MVRIQKIMKKGIVSLLAAFLVVTQIPASMNKVEATDHLQEMYMYMFK